MPNIIRSGGSGLLPSVLNSLTTKPENVLTGKTFIGEGSKLVQTGTMPNQGAINVTLVPGESISRTNGYYSSILVQAPAVTEDNYGNAAQGDVLGGKTFTSSAGVKLTGTMSNVANSDLIMSSTRTTNYFIGNGSSSTNIRAEIVTPYNKSTGELSTVTYLALNTGDVGRYFPPNSYLGMTVSAVGNATAAQVLADMTFTSSEGVKVTGTMVDWTDSPNQVTNIRWNNNRVEIAVKRGYHHCLWTGTNTSYEYFASNAFGDAATTDVLSGKEFTSSNGLKITGSIPTITDNTTYFYSTDNTQNPVIISNGWSDNKPKIRNIYNSSGTASGQKYLEFYYTGTKGYVGENCIFAIPAVAASIGSVTAGQVLDDKTFTSTAGVCLTGTMPNNGKVTESISPGQSYTIPAGYHNGSGTVTATTPDLTYTQLARQNKTSVTSYTYTFTKAYTKCALVVTGLIQALANFSVTISGTGTLTQKTVYHFENDASAAFSSAIYIGTGSNIKSGDKITIKSGTNHIWGIGIYILSY